MTALLAWWIWKSLCCREIASWVPPFSAISLLIDRRKSFIIFLPDSILSPGCGDVPCSHRRGEHVISFYTMSGKLLMFRREFMQKFLFVSGLWEAGRSFHLIFRGCIFLTMHPCLEPSLSYPEGGFLLPSAADSVIYFQRKQTWMQWNKLMGVLINANNLHYSYPNHSHF